jgi:hypothetical protein
MEVPESGRKPSLHCEAEIALADPLRRFSTALRGACSEVGLVRGIGSVRSAAPGGTLCISSHVVTATSSFGSDDRALDCPGSANRYGAPTERRTIATKSAATSFPAHALPAPDRRVSQHHLRLTRHADAPCARWSGCQIRFSSVSPKATARPSGMRPITMKSRPPRDQEASESSPRCPERIGASGAPLAMMQNMKGEPSAST